MGKLPTSKPAPTVALEPAVIVVFGITGDLAGRYLLPALYQLFKDDLLNEHTEIIGLTRQDITTDDLFAKVELCINEKEGQCDAEGLRKTQAHTQLLRFDPEHPDDYATLRKKLDELEEQHGLCMNRLYYLSIPPKLFTDTVHNLGKAGLQKSCMHNNAKSRLLVEKPFGHDITSAEELITTTDDVFTENQVFRIDHYLAKETVQNILTFRASNPIFGSIWNNRHIQAIDILAAEQIGIEGRVTFYEGLGALRDLVQSHLLQLLAVTTMTLPTEFTSDTIHTHKQSLLESIHPADPAQAVRGQYESYKQEVNNADSNTETYVSLKLAIDNDTWHGVPVTITTGKGLRKKNTEVRVTFTDTDDDSAATNVLTFRIQPNEGIHLQLQVKTPGFEHAMQEAAMDFSYQSTFGNSNHPNAYERVLVDAVKGDRTLFATGTEVLASWRILEPVIQAWQDNAKGLHIYPNGSDGPGDLVQ
jgi:glucose-6-phosphate 1-dehydrogenase